MIQHHLEIGTLVLIGGCIPGMVLNRIDAFYYTVLSQGMLHKVHRDDMVECDS